MIPTHCPRCHAPLIRNHDVRECLIHGTQWEPPRAYDAAGLWDQADREEMKARGIRPGTWGATVVVKPVPAWQFEDYEEGFPRVCCGRPWSDAHRYGIHRARMHRQEEQE